MLRVRILLIQPWIVFFLKNWRHLNFYEHFIKKFHIKKVKCLVKWLGWRAVASGLYECVRILITVRDYRLGFLEPASKYRSAVHVLRWIGTSYRYTLRIYIPVHYSSHKWSTYPALVKQNGRAGFETNDWHCSPAYHQRKTAVRSNGIRKSATICW